MKRVATPVLSRSGESALRQYEQVLCEQEDLTPASVRNYLSDVRQFMAWYEAYRAEQAADAQGESGFDPQAVTIPTITRYRTYLQTVQKQRSASVNRALISLKRYFGWAIRTHLILYIGLRAREVCQLRHDQVKLGKRSGFLEVIGKRNKYREVPLNATARKALEEYLPTLPPETLFLFPSGKTKEALSERALGYIVKKYAISAKLLDVSPHDLRHRFGYRMAASVPLHRLAQIMGHDSLDTTKFYIQGTKPDLQQAVEAIART